jgi:hypothetical protein
MAWRCSGVGRPAGARVAVLRWEGGRTSPLTPGRELGFRARDGRTCTGARGHPCPVRAAVPERSVSARCGECARLDRAHSVAADGDPGDPRVYRVYLAWFGPGLVKVGITAEERGPARLVDQGAVVFSWLGRGPLMAARRTEELLRAALGVPDRIPYAARRAARHRLPGPGARTEETAALHARALALGGWAETLEPLPYEPADHTGLFGLGQLEGPASVVLGLVPGGAVTGTLVAVAGPDLHLRTAGHGPVVLDSRLLTGWTLVAAGPSAGVSVPLAVPEDENGENGGVQDGLF